MKDQPLFIVFEGPSGAGKTTQAELLRKYCPDAYFTREPGGTPFGEEIRNLVQRDRNIAISPMAAAFGYCASRANLVDLEIRPRLEQGQRVVCDRYYPSTVCYQGGEGVDINDILQLARIATRGLEPDYYIYIDLPVDEIIGRKIGCEDIDRYDEKMMKDENFLKAVVSRYNWLRRNNDNWISIDGRGSVDDVHERVLTAVQDIGFIRQ